MATVIHPLPFHLFFNVPDSKQQSKMVTSIVVGLKTSAIVLIKTVSIPIICISCQLQHCLITITESEKTNNKISC